MLFVYQCKREYYYYYYLSEFKVLFIIYGQLTVSETKCIIRKHQLGRGDCSYSLCIRANHRNIQFETRLIRSSCFRSLFLGFLSFEFEKFLNIYLSIIVLLEVLPSESILFFKEFQ